MRFGNMLLTLVSMAWKGKIWIPNWITHDQSRRMGRGVFSLPEVPVVTDKGANVIAEVAQEVTNEELVTA